MKSIANLQGFRKNVTRFSTDELVKEFFLETASDKKLPIVFQPKLSDFDHNKWINDHKSLIEQKLFTHGAILFRGFNIKTVEDFQIFSEQISPELLKYKERSSPRTEVGKAIYTSTDYPADQSIQFHNEQSYTKSYPMKLFFYCRIPSDTGGETPLADGRTVINNLSNETVEIFKRKKVLYRRNYGNGMGLSWQEAFQTKNKDEVEKFCRKEGIFFEWKSDKHLRTEQIFDTVTEHPYTKETVWFEHAAFFHISGLPENIRNSFLKEFGEENLPSNTYFGDGTVIEEKYLNELRSAYQKAAVKFTWQKFDLLLIDNVLVSHSRSPFTGERKVLVAMSELFSPA